MMKYVDNAVFEVKSTYHTYGAALKNELGKLQNRNQARVRYTTADWYNLEKERKIVVAC